ncbi:MAG: hypothetical protein JWL85_330, partial [Candidatus Saccharibacteria bacterium]|nr:hypothetical protein [Candidatus Saccharibacteria bacterium]
LFANRADTILSVTWKPAEVWSDASGSNEVVNAEIDAAANDIKSLGATKIMLTLYHEPEDNVSGGAESCDPTTTTYKGTNGTPADYRAMWQNVRNRFDALQVTNVVWVMNYMGFSTWDCMIKDLWPGNNLVDWVEWDPYTSNGDFSGLVSRFYGYLEANSDAEHDFVSKPWGLAEWGSWKTATQANTYALYDGAKAALEANTFPRLKSYQIFDVSGTSRISYDSAASFDQAEVDSYKSFANHFRLVGTGTPPDMTAPTAPSSLVGEVAGSQVTLSWQAATDDIGVASYAITRDGQQIGTTTGLTFVDQTLTQGASYSYAVMAIDEAGNSSSPTVLNVVVPDTTLPTTPTGFTATLSGSSVKVSWQAATDNVGVAGYYLLRDNVRIASLSATTLTYTDTTAPQGLNHTYTVRAYDAAGNKGALTVGLIVAVPDTTAPTVPTGLKGTAGSKSVTLSWTAPNDNVGVTGYYVYQGTKLLGSVTATNAKVTGLTTGTSYSFTVKAYDAAGNVSTASTSVTVKSN